VIYCGDGCHVQVPEAALQKEREIAQEQATAQLSQKKPGAGNAGKGPSAEDIMNRMVQVSVANMLQWCENWWIKLETSPCFQGRLNKFFEQSCLLDQQYLIVQPGDKPQKVSQVVESVLKGKAHIGGFARWQVGETVVA